MSAAGTIELSALREIGWRDWNPIGLLAVEGQWRDAPFADEYDSYLLQGVSRLRRGEDEARVADYLVDIETGHMGLMATADARSRALATVKALAAYLATFPIGPLKVR